ncbi:hypothetical protein PV762_16765 [Mitsuaria sp. CC2]|uniref:hypothetical protein n=1 Tax=Mitsuaria sp. CC2 TaxID=3029186 RepID=UPI003B8DC329
MDWLTLHKSSEALAARAHAALREGNSRDAEELFRQAAVAEEDALAQLDMSKPRTFGIAAVSAVSLWYKGKDLQRASMLAYRCLAIPDLASPAREQLDDLVQTLYTERDRQRLTGEFLPGSVTVAVKGGDVLRGAAPLDLIVDKVKTLQAIFFRVVEWSNGKPLRRHGPPTKDITGSFEPWLVQEPAGSFRFSVAVKVNGQLDMFDTEKLEAADIARKFLDVVTTVAADATGEASKELVADDGYRGTFRKLIRNLTPPVNSTESVAISSKEREGVEVVLDESTRPKLDLAIKAESPKADESVGEQMQEFTGVLRALDLDSDWLKVDVDNGQVTVKGLSQAVDDVIGPMVNKAVLVKAVKTKRGELKFVDISLAT